MNVDVININAQGSRPPNSVYIGRPYLGSTQIGHYGNPFSHEHSVHPIVKVASREDAVQSFRDWLDGNAWHEIEPLRRLWILAGLMDLAESNQDITLACYCVP